MANYLCSYKPLIKTKQGNIAVNTFNMAPFVDGSCRREPDFESRFPSISALCRAGMFAPRLHEGDRVVYITVKGHYAENGHGHWRLVAIMKVLKKFDSHESAAEWYREQGIPLPNNCLIKNNEPFPFKLTSGSLPKTLRDRKSSLDVLELVRLWDRTYKKRVLRYPVFLACEVECLELHDPPILTRETMNKIFGRIPATRNPPRISDHEVAGLKDFFK